MLHADEALLVLEKPAGLLAVPGRGEDKQDCLSRRAQAQWPDALVVHRLDMSTSGLVVMARGLEAQRALSRAFEQRRVHKRYLAVVAGHLANPQPDNGWNTIDLPLAVDWINRPRSKVCLETGKPSLTRWRLAQPTAQTPPAHTGIGTRVELEPITGRTHQLRVHCAHPAGLDAPILGDRLYGRTAPEHGERLLLHAERLSFVHPVTGMLLELTSDAAF